MTMENDRRSFLKQGVLIGTGLIIGLKNNVMASISTDEAMTELNPFVMIDSKGIVTIVNSRIEMGQGGLQAVTTLIAEELEVSPEQIKVIPSGGQMKFGTQHTGASSTVRAMGYFLRQQGQLQKPC